MEIVLGVDRTATADKTHRSKFFWQAWFIVDYLNVHYYKKVKIDGGHQVRIGVTDSLDNNGRIEMPVKGFPAYRVVTYFDFVTGFVELSDDLLKRKCIVNLLHDSLLQLAKLMSWDTTPFNEVYEQIALSGYEFCGKYNKGRSDSPSHLQANLKFCVRAQEIEIFLDVKSKRTKASQSIPLLKYQTEIHFDIPSIRSLIDKGKWLTDNLYQVSNNSNEILYNVNVTTGDVDMGYRPTGGTKEIYLREKLLYATTTDIELRSALKKKWW